MKTLLKRITLVITLSVVTVATETLVLAQGFNYSHRYSTTARSMSNRAAMRAALRKARQRKSRKAKPSRNGKKNIQGKR